MSRNHPEAGGNNGDERRSTLQCGSQGMDSSSYQLTDLEDTEFNWENSKLEMDAVFRPGIYTPFSPTTFDDSSMEGSIENPIVLEEAEDKENAPPPTPSTPVSVRSTEFPRLQRSRGFGARIEKVPDFVHRSFSQYILPCWCLDIIFKYRVSFYQNIFQKLVRHVWD